MWIVGRRGIRFQDKSGKMVDRAPGEPIPEAADFPNIRALVSNERLVWQEDKSQKLPKAAEEEEIKEPAVETIEPKIEPAVKVDIEPKKFTRKKIKRG